MIRPAREKNRRRRVLVVTTCSPTTGPRCPTGQVMKHLPVSPAKRSTGGETARRHVVQPHDVLQVSNGVLDLGMAAVICNTTPGLPGSPVGDEAVIAVGGEEGQLGTGSGLHPPDSEPHRSGDGLTLEGGAGGLGHIGGAVHPVWDGRPVRLGYAPRSGSAGFCAGAW